MKKLLTILALLSGLNSYAQEAKFESFRLIIVKPDTAIIDPALFNYRDSITKGQIEKYYRGVKTYEDMANCKNCDFEKEDVERYKSMAMALKKLAPEVQKFKYFELLSTFSAEVYNFYFNAYDPLSIITELPSQPTSLAALKKLAANKNVDYILFFTQVRTSIESGLPVLQLTTSMYSRKENKMILSVETLGDTNSRGEMWNCTNPLSCLFINGVRTSTNEVSALLRKLQAKKPNGMNK